MSINRTSFVREFTVLLERFGRASDVSEILIERYRAFLDQHLSTQEFEAAAQHIFNHDQFWPAPQRFVDAVHGNAKQLADTEWQQVMRLASAGSHDLSRLSDRAAAALKAAGGMREVMFADGEFSLEQKRKRFVASYEAVSAPRPPGLPEHTVTPVLPGLEMP